MRRGILHLSLAAGVLLACGGEEGESIDAASLPQVAGHYEVTGVTVETEGGAQRPLRGTIVLTQDGDRYTARFELTTPYGGSGAAVAAVVGTGEGRVVDRRLEGRAETQLVLAQVPGVDVGFAFVPREVGPRIVSTSEAELFPDGTMRIALQNRPASEQEDYAPSQTTLVGYRVAESALPPD